MRLSLSPFTDDQTPRARKQITAEFIEATEESSLQLRIDDPGTDVGTDDVADALVNLGTIEVVRPTKKERTDVRAHQEEGG